LGATNPAPAAAAENTRIAAVASPRTGDSTYLHTDGTNLRDFIATVAIEFEEPILINDEEAGGATYTVGIRCGEVVEAVAAVEQELRGHLLALNLERDFEIVEIELQRVTPEDCEPEVAHCFPPPYAGAGVFYSSGMMFYGE
jgi:hypothetical protein